MSLDPEKAEGIPRKLIGMYSDTELSLLGMMADAMSKGTDSDDWYAQQTAEALRFRNAAQRLAAGLSKAAPTVVGEAVGEAVKFGHAAVDEDIDLAGHLAAKSGRRAGLQANISIDDKASKLTRKAVADGVGTLAIINQALPGAASQLYQQVTARVNATPASSDLTRRQAVQQALDVLTARGITGFRDNAGRNWSLSTYVEMKSRTLVNNTLMQSHIDRMLDRGMDLVVVSSHRNPAPQCQPFEGQVLSIGDAPKGTTVRPNATGGDPVKVKIKATMDEARAQGFRHPNCRHSVAAFIPGASRTFTTEPDEEGYKATQQLRAMERAIRETKRRQAVAIEPSVKKRLGATLRSQQSTLKAHVDAHDLKRRSLRERPDLGYRLNPPDALDSVTDVPTPKPGPDLGDYLAAEEKYKTDVADWLKAEKAHAADVKKWLAAEKKFNASRTLSQSTRDLIEQSRATMPTDRAGWLDTTLRYPRDKNGAKLVPEKLQRHLDTTLTVGKAIHTDAIKRIDKDATIKRLRAEDKQLVSTDPFSPRRQDVKRDIARREQVIIRETLAEIRPFGGVQQVTEISSLDIGGATRGTAAGLAAIRRAETIFPADWLRAATARGTLKVGSSDRAFHNGDYDFIAAPTKDYKPTYRGAFDSYNDEVVAHELGHRMERTIPGLTQLEFALVRSRSTKNGVLEDLKPVYPKRPDLANEVGYEDDWRDRYAGKMYSTDAMADPATRSAEAFQVGLQDTFGRGAGSGGEFDKTTQLQEFVIGVMALL